MVYILLCHLILFKSSFNSSFNNNLYWTVVRLKKHTKENFSSVTEAYMVSNSKQAAALTLEGFADFDRSSWPFKLAFS